MPRIQKVLKYVSWPKRAQFSRKDIVSKIDYDPTKYTQHQILKKHGEGNHWLLRELGKGGGLPARSRKRDRNLSENPSTSIPEVTAYFNWNKWGGYYNIYANKLLEVQMLSISKIPERDLHFLTQRRDINQLLAFPPPSLTILSGTSLHLHQWWFKQVIPSLEFSGLPVNIPSFTPDKWTSNSFSWKCSCKGS